MAKTQFKSVDAYIASQSDTAQVALELVRSAIRRALPEADEVISYNIPTYKQHGAAVLYFAGWKEHYSIYPVGAALLEAFQDELASRKVEKATVRFSLSDPVPVKLIERIAKFRAVEAAERRKAKPAVAKRAARK